MKLLEDEKASLEDVREYISDDFHKVNQIISQSLSYKGKTIDTIANYVISAGGKRLRPLFVMLSAKMFNYRGDGHIKIASAVEFIHTATLLHDDVVDSSKMRRGIATANEEWSNKYAILVGDFLFSQSFQLMVSSGSMRVLDILSASSSIIAEGEIKQLDNISNINTTQETYLEIIKSKTAELFGAACKSGAIIAEQSEDIANKMYEFGINIGIAFQIIDDILDYTSDNTGKDVGNDYKEGKVTLPIILAYSDITRSRNASPTVDIYSYEAKFIEKLFKDIDQQKEDFEKLINILNSRSSFEKSKELAGHFIDLAKSIIDAIPKSQEFIDMFDAILNYQINRIN